MTVTPVRQSPVINKHLPFLKAVVGPGNADFDFGCKLVSFVRHAEGEHQVANRAAQGSAWTKARVIQAQGEFPMDEAAAIKRRWDNWPVHWQNPSSVSLTDAPLSNVGRAQCVAAAASVEVPELVVVSPLRRALETAYIMYAKTVPQPKFVVHDLCRETYGEFTCDKRMAMTVNKAWKPGIYRYASDDLWNSWDWGTQESSPSAKDREVMPYADLDVVWQTTRETDDHVNSRINSFLLWLLTREERKIAVVTHSSFMRHMFLMMFGKNEVADNARPMPFLLCPSVLQRSSL